MGEKDAIRLQKEYANMLKEQEEKREKRLKATYEKQQQKFQALMSATSGIREKAEEDARKAEIELRRRQELQDKKEQLKKEKLENEMAACKAAIDEKMSKMKQDILEDKAYGKKMTKLHGEYLAEIDAKKAEKYRKQNEQSEYLEQQIAALEKKKQEQKTEMSETEKLLNKGLLDQVRKFKLSPNAKKEMMKKKKDSITVDPRAPFQFRYQIRKTPF